MVPVSPAGSSVISVLDISCPGSIVISGTSPSSLPADRFSATIASTLRSRVQSSSVTAAKKVSCRGYLSVSLIIHWMQ